MQSKKRALGRGLSALLPPKPATEPDHHKTASIVPIAPEDVTPDGDRVRRVPLSDIHPNPRQPRGLFDDAALEDLANSIKAHGVIQPAIVTRRPAGLMLVAGERRWRAAQRAGLTEMPVIEVELNDQELLEYALVENLQRENLNAMEEARGYRALIDSFGLSQDDVAGRMGKSRPAVANALRLLGLPDDIQHDVEAGRLSAGHARAVLMVADDALRHRVRDAIVKDALSVRAAEALAQRLATQPGSSKTPRAKGPVRKPDDIKRLEEALLDRFACRVAVRVLDDKRGRIEIHYDSLDQLDGILETLGIEL